MTDQNSSFKFVDKRRVDESGDLRSDVEQKQENPLPPPSSTTTPRERPPINFSMYIQTIAHQVLMLMGLVPWPDSGIVKAELDHAKEMIDVLGMIREKTKGNLTPDEDKMFETLLYELRVAFMSVKQGAPMPPPPGAAPQK